MSYNLAPDFIMPNDNISIITCFIFNSIHINGSCIKMFVLRDSGYYLYKMPFSLTAIIEDGNSITSTEVNERDLTKTRLICYGGYL